MVQEGAVAHLVGILQKRTEEQKTAAAKTISLLATDAEVCPTITMACERSIAPLVTLLQEGTNEQQSHAERVLNKLLGNNASSVGLVHQGAIRFSLEALAKRVNDRACHTELVRDGVLLLLIKLLRGGTEKQKPLAVRTPWMLIMNDENGPAIARKGAAPLVGFLRDETVEQNAHASRALGKLAENDAYKGDIIREGGTALFLELA
ncbi:hypothetical protein ON010_g15959 [Phytophthora cinnamomi]|nr:hypothetical protein ON010_g15959 [Phytophthora cinnamomi]